MRELWRALCAVVQELHPNRLSLSLNRWVRDQHRPFDVAGDGTGPAVCQLDGRPWPCKAWLAADERVSAAGPRP